MPGEHRKLFALSDIVFSRQQQRGDTQRKAKGGVFVVKYVPSSDSIIAGLALNQTFVKFLTQQIVDEEVLSLHSNLMGRAFKPKY